MGALPALHGDPNGGRQLENDEFFTAQRARLTDLPDPEPLLRNLTVGVLEALAGVREVEQLARWLSEETFLSVAKRCSLAARARSARGLTVARPQHQIMSLRTQHPTDGVVESVVIVRTPTRTRAIAIRLEGLDQRWRATSMALL